MIKTIFNQDNCFDHDQKIFFDHVQHNVFDNFFFDHQNFYYHDQKKI